MLIREQVCSRENGLKLVTPLIFPLRQAEKSTVTGFLTRCLTFFTVIFGGILLMFMRQLHNAIIIDKNFVALKKSYISKIQ